MAVEQHQQLSSLVCALQKAGIHLDEIEDVVSRTPKLDAATGRESDATLMSWQTLDKRSTKVNDEGYIGNNAQHSVGEIKMALARHMTDGWAHEFENIDMSTQTPPRLQPRNQPIVKDRYLPNKHYVSKTCVFVKRRPNSADIIQRFADSKQKSLASHRNQRKAHFRQCKALVSHI